MDTNTTSKVKILLVEDEALIALHEADMLKKNGYEVIVASDDGSAIEAVRQDASISLILLDVDLGAGIDISRIVSEIEAIRALPVIILTHYEDKSVIETIKNITRYGYVLKNSGEHILIGTIDKALELFKAHQETKKSEKLYRAVLTDISDAVFVTDESGAFIFICPNLDVLFGYSVAEVETFQNIKNLLGDLVISKKELDKKGEIVNVERKITDKNGDPHQVLINIKRVEIGRGTRLYTCRDITALRESENKYRDLAAHINLLREEQEQHIARELHDGLGQDMALVRLQLVRMIKEHACLEKQLGPVIKRVDKMIGSVRSIVTHLRPFPLDEVGLQSAIEARLEELTETTGIACTKLTLPDALSVSPHVLQSVYKIFQEALANVARHADASEIAVVLSVEEESLRLKVKDNGKGLEIEETIGLHTFGLLGMFERAELLGGELSVSGNPGQGTEVVFSLPLHKVLQEMK